MHDTTTLKLHFPDYLSRIGVKFKSDNRVENLQACCPLHLEKSPSFHVTLKNGIYVYHCFGCDSGGTVLDLHAKLNGMNIDTEFNAVVEAVSRVVGLPYERRPNKSQEKVPAISTGPTLPPDATWGTLTDWREIAHSRNVSLISVATAAAHLGTLKVGTQCGKRSWILTDPSGKSAEARRMDRKPYEAFASIGERKAHTLKGSVKSWPVGLFTGRYKVNEFRAVLAVEGGPDYLAALHFTLHGKADCLPVAFLGAGACGEIHPEALKALRGCRVRFYQHADASGGTAVTKWANQLAGIGCKVDAFTFTGLRKADGSPVKDLNDCTSIHTDDRDKLGDLLP